MTRAAALYDARWQSLSQAGYCSLRGGASQSWHAPQFSVLMRSDRSCHGLLGTILHKPTRSDTMAQLRATFPRGSHCVSLLPSP